MRTQHLYRFVCSRSSPLAKKWPQKFEYIKDISSRVGLVAPLLFVMRFSICPWANLENPAHAHNAEELFNYIAVGRNEDEAKLVCTGTGRNASLALEQTSGPGDIKFPCVLDFIEMRRDIRSERTCHVGVPGVGGEPDRLRVLLRLSDESV